MSRSLRNLFVTGAIISLAACNRCGGPRPGGDADRPPIIVGDGSMHVRAVSKDFGAGTNNERGRWSQSGNIWRHMGTYDQPNHLYVSVIKGDRGSTDDCKKPDVAFKTRKLKITYTNGSADTSFDIYIDGNGKGDLLTTFAGLQDAYVPWWLDISDPTLYLKLVEFKTVGNENVSCTLKKGSEVHVYQSNK